MATPKSEFPEYLYVVRDDEGLFLAALTPEALVAGQKAPMAKYRFQTKGVVVPHEATFEEK